MRASSEEQNSPRVEIMSIAFSVLAYFMHNKIIYRGCRSRFRNVVTFFIFMTSLVYIVMDPDKYPLCKTHSYFFGMYSAMEDNQLSQYIRI